VILTGFSAVLGIHLLWSLAGSGPPRALAIIGTLFAIASATYTAWLFAQAKARDLWQSPMLPLQHLVASVLAGASALVVAAAFVVPGLVPLLTIIAAAGTGTHLILIAAEVFTPHPTAHARLAVREMVRGKYRMEFAAGVILSLLGLITMPFHAVAAVLMLLGLLLYEQAHVGAGQAVPLA
jgi:formate-dependent nitrite reductase membrane component NrfD